jgi:general secretion pathway protein A
LPASGPLGPVLHEARPTGLTYEPFYVLKEKPFSLTSDSRFFYHSRSHAPAFDDLLAGIRRRESLNVLTGDIGTGKTTLCRAVLQNLDRKTFSAFVPDPFASREDLLKVLLMDFGVASVDDLTSGRLRDASRTELSYLLYEFLGTLAPLQAFAVVIIDEAQNLSIPLLEEIRILSDADGQLQVVLVGQLELRHKLKLPEMRQVDQRVSVHCNLSPLECDGVAGYVAHRLQTAGGSPDRVRFSPDAIEAIYRVSGGVPRVINRLCDRALYQGHLRRAATIDREILEAAVPEAVPFVAAARVAVPGLVAVPVASVQTPAPVPNGAPEPFPDPVDVWLSVVDEGGKAYPAVPVPIPPCSSGVPRPGGSRPAAATHLRARKEATRQARGAFARAAHVHGTVHAAVAPEARDGGPGRRDARRRARRRPIGSGGLDRCLGALERAAGRARDSRSPRRAASPPGAGPDASAARRSPAGRRDRSRCRGAAERDGTHRRPLERNRFPNTTERPATTVEHAADARVAC